LRPRDIVTLKALENAAAIVAATAARQCGAASAGDGQRGRIKFDLFDVAAIFKAYALSRVAQTRWEYVAKDMWEAGGVPMLLKTLLDAASFTAIA